MKEIDMLFGDLFIGALVVALCCVSVLIYEQSSMLGPFKQAVDALEQCEKSLPRDQECVIIAIPEDKK